MDEMLGTVYVAVTLTVTLLFGGLAIALGRISRLRARVEDLERTVKQLARSANV